MANFSCPEPYRLLITCEHAGNTVPPELQYLFAGHAEVLQTHLAYDPYALDLAGHIARSFGAPLLATTVSRLLVDCNRSATSRNLFSTYGNRLTPLAKKRIRAAYHTPHREAVTRTATRIIGTGAVLVHIAVHSFTPELNGKKRRADIGLLYDPARSGEKELCTRWQRQLQTLIPSLRVRKNYPYLGKTDGIATMLRQKHSEQTYLGIELEINQETAEATSIACLHQGIVSSLSMAMHAFAHEPLNGLQK